MTRPALLFDLDGTLVDSIRLIVESGRHAFGGFAGRAPTDDEWRAGIGRPLVSMFREFAPDDAEVERLVLRYREYQGANHDRLLYAYDGVGALLDSLAADGYRMALVTSKVEWLAERALEHTGMRRHFPVLIGCDTCDNHKPHPEPVHRALEALGVTASQALFIGDSPHDVEAGRAAGVRTVGVTWGAFTRAEMERSGADVVVHTVPELDAAIRQS